MLKEMLIWHKQTFKSEKGYKSRPNDRFGLKSEQGYKSRSNDRFGFIYALFPLPFPFAKEDGTKREKTLQERSNGEGETGAERVGRESVSDRELLLIPKIVVSLQTQWDA